MRSVDASSLSGRKDQELENHTCGVRALTLDLPLQLDTQISGRPDPGDQSQDHLWEADYRTNRPRGPFGHPGLFVVLSYQRSYVDLDIARLVRDERLE